MRVVSDGDGRQWEVFLEWEGRRVTNRLVRRIRERREARAARRGEDRSLELLDGCINLGTGESLAAMTATVAIGVIVLLAGPWALALLFGIVEFGLIIVLLAVGFVSRTLFRRPWRVAAVSHQGEVWAWRQVGFGAARSLVDDVADRIALGVPPTGICADQLEADRPRQIPPGADLGVVARPGVHVAAVIATVALLVVAAALLIAFIARLLSGAMW